MKTAGRKRLVFSSTCATYGEPEADADRRDNARRAGEPLRWSKWCVEAGPAGLRSPSRSFRCRAALFQRGPARRPTARWARTHARDAPDSRPLAGRARETRKVTVFGTTIPRPTARASATTCHVEDLCGAHIRGDETPLQPGDTRSTTWASAAATRVREVIESARRHRASISPSVRPPPSRRPPILFANADKIPPRTRLVASYTRSTPSWQRPGSGFRTIRAATR